MVNFSVGVMLLGCFIYNEWKRQDEEDKGRLLWSIVLMLLCMFNFICGYFLW
ncbi:hypothetical protein BigBertha_6 [Bacillus phage BigBertha]|uniref:Uncharacterized protein n=1 Tax=Bacillus phage BigBertha TaxID=1406781 RepID=U5PRN7_9CAUD|nr:hypothetical protein BigBertha_6 [Bacillus phage BigBertha]AGY46514.1 hypothetical protein BigBertha_6 [Bacillus phage BigBertha]